MASGCIVGDCPVCDFWVYEDDFAMVGDITVHEFCKEQYIKNKYHISEEQYKRLFGIAEFRKDFEILKLSISDTLAHIEERLLDLEEKQSEDIREKIKEHYNDYEFKKY